VDSSAATPNTDPVMAAVRLEVPVDADPYVLEAVLTQAICGAAERPMSAEVALLPSGRGEPGGRMRRYAFVALLSSSTAAHAGDLIRTAEEASRAAVRERFGSRASAQARPVTAGREFLACWCSLRGTPYRMYPQPPGSRGPADDPGQQTPAW
jgi:hypothetical protein